MGVYDVNRKQTIQLGFAANATEATAEANAEGGIVAPAAVTIAASAYAFSRELLVRQFTRADLYVIITGSGSIDIDVLGSPEETDRTNSPFALYTAVTVAEGATAGKWFSVDPLGPHAIKIRAQETGGVSSAVLTAWLTLIP